MSTNKKQIITNILKTKIMKSLNLKSLFLAMTAALLVFSSCKKDKDDAPAPAPTIEGTWVGKYGPGNNVPTNYFSFIINKDGTMKVKSDGNTEYTGTGTWKLTGDTFTAVYQYSGQNMKWNVAAKTNIAAGTMEGSYGDGEVVADNGTYTMTRQ
jgi:hypothetical protein